MVGLGVLLLVLAGVSVVVGLVLYGTGVGTVPDEPMRDATATRRGVSRIRLPELFATMKTSVRSATRSDADKAQRQASMGAFLVLVGLILVVLAVLLFITSMV
jgi:hypothetical protein